MSPVIFLWFGSVFSPVLPLCFARRSWKGAEHRTILFFVLASFLSDLLTTFVIEGNNHTFLAAYGLAEALLLMLFFRNVLSGHRILINILIVLFTLFYLADALYIESETFNASGRAIECLVMIFLSLLLFYQFYKEEEDIFIERNSLFWINVAILAYFSGSFFSFILINEVMLKGLEPWAFHNLSNILKNILLAIGLWRIQT